MGEQGGEVQPCPWAEVEPEEQAVLLLRKRLRSAMGSTCGWHKAGAVGALGSPQTPGIPGLWLQSRVRDRSGPRLPQPLQLDPQHKQRLFLQEELLRLLLADPLLEQLLTQLWPQTLQLLPQPTVCPRWRAWPIGNSGWMANRLPGRQGPALFCSSDEGPPQPWWGVGH